MKYVFLPIEMPRSDQRIERVAGLPDDSGPGGGAQSGVTGQAGVTEPGDLAAQMSGLLAQLYDRPVTLAAERLAGIVANPANRLLVAREDGRIRGTGTVVFLETLRGTHARVEDVVVDERARGQGVGAALTRAALHLAAQEGAELAELTSRPSRAAAQRLYQRLGFTKVETNVYRHYFGG